jgi:hypothetical protein
MPLACLPAAVGLDAWAVGLGFKLGREIRKLTTRPPTWPVYFEGDQDLEWQDAAKVIDLIRGSKAEVVLLTPRRQAKSDPDQ